MSGPKGTTCPQCGARADDLAARFCAGCGARLAGERADAAPSPPKTATGAPTPLSMSWLHFLGLGGVGVGLLAFAYFSLSEEPNGWGVLAAVFGVFFVIASPLVRAGACPACGTTVRVAMFERCSGCREFLRVEAKTLRIAEPGFIAKGPAFEVKLGILSTPPAVEWPWPGSCAVCAGPATRTLPLQVRMGTGQRGAFIETTTWTIPVPHCAAHDTGIAWRTDSTDGRGCQIITFRSVDHARAFERANRGRLA